MYSFLFVIEPPALALSTGMVLAPETRANMFLNSNWKPPVLRLMTYAVTYTRKGPYLYRMIPAYCLLISTWPPWHFPKQFLAVWIRRWLLDFISAVPLTRLPPPGPQLQELDRSGTGPEQQPLDQSDPPRNSTARARSQWPPPDPDSNRWIKVIPAGPQLQELDRSGPRRT